MENSAAWLLTIFVAVAAVIINASPTPTSPTTVRTSEADAMTGEIVETTPKNNFIDYARPFTNMKDILMHEIQTLDKDALDKDDAKIQEEVAKTLKAEAQRDSINLRTKTTPKPSKTIVKLNSILDQGEELKKLEPMGYEDDNSYEDTDDDLSDEEYEDEDSRVDDNEEIMTECPDYCKCVGQYASATTATCTKLTNDQSFGSIAHLRIENAGEIQLGPNALRARGLQQLESITIVDTRIVELDRTAFNGISYLFAVNLTRNGLQDIHPNTFQNNTQLSLLTIADNPLKHMHDSRPTKHYLLHAPSVTDFDFSNNGISRLKRTAFSKMHSLNFINLRGNRLREIDSTIFDTLDQLLEVDLSDNILNEIPIDLFVDKDVQILRVAGNNLSTLATISSSKLTTLDASRNKIKAIGKEDLEGVPLLDQLYVKTNNLKRIHQHAFSKLDQLQYLDISDNRLSLLTEHHFKLNPRLQILLMNDNPGLQELPVFKTYGLEHNTFSIIRFECANCGLDSIKLGTFDEMPALTRLKLANNRLADLPDGLLDNLSSLRELDLSNNFISTLQPNMFRGAVSLNKLILSRNPLRTLQVTPFLSIPGLFKLDVSRCNLERVWSEARVPLKSLRFLSVRGNLLRRITVEELKAMPHLTSLDLTHNPLDCDSDFSEALQWLNDHGVAPTEVLELVSDKFDIEDNDKMDISQWTDLARIVCDGIEDGPPGRSLPGKGTHRKDILLDVDVVEDSDPLLKNELDNDEKLNIDHGMQHVDEPRLMGDQEYDEDFAVTTEYHTWYNLRPGFKVWLVSGTVLSVLVVFLLVARIACCLANKRGRGPVIRPPLILRQGLVDNKNCGLVYKPLQEEIATPHMPKRGSFYSSSTFHYDKIVPERV
ncbi:PREDICTED: toll-like receptor 3 [Vollenhovia emeryi]|uniref:toll-like receptor 3 n=1 Tax=Vollenhovia emeryi TaxID=411798 RepID=UPI0005F3F82A|nr:PREDICTED: toll-like receptor 3 [Vollenhovia emeryi]XP_011882250.1 PREDICTED: toll-like receptor 3 [Vollenhovia emeryi]XP_011882251.1 PREDICTED: toll-like receptor 3 [Vollenhovia emeryi]XP_011882252.1 PREDICTED: toll-like receptor 3 [Vollenhovia emeryi]